MKLIITDSCWQTVIKLEKCFCFLLILADSNDDDLMTAEIDFIEQQCKGL